MIRLYFYIPIFLMLFIVRTAPAQVIATEPDFPVLSEPLTITFDASASSRGELEGYTGDLYVHTGVITEPGGDWEYVIGDWGDNQGQPQLTNVGEDMWELHIEDIREFYELPASVVTIHQLAFVFRSADAGRQTEDLFVDIANDPVNVRFVTPSPDPLNPQFAGVGEEIPIEIVADAAEGDLTSVTLYINEVEVAAVSEQTLTYTYTVPEEGRAAFRAVAENSEGDQAESMVYVVANPEVEDAVRPEGITDGINYHEADEGRVTLSLFAPHKEFVYVIGDFNDWEVDTGYFMKRDSVDSDHIHYWLEIDGLEPGKEYGFQYLIDGELRVADPYTEKVLDPWNDEQIIEEGRYPGLIPYPENKTLHAVSVLQTAREPYEWQTEDFEPSEVEDLVIYELLIRDFLDEPRNTYRGLRDTLGYLEKLGVNAIELMPVTHFEGNLSWGYNPAFYFAADKYYGPRRELKKLIDEAHSRGMAVILDMVWNHSYGQSPLLRMYYDAVNNAPAENNPWYMTEDLFPTNPGMNFGYKFDHGSEHFIGFMDRANRHWLEEYRIDGFRFDLTKGFTTDIKGSDDEWGSRYDQERVDNLLRLREAVHSVNPEAYVILEHFADNDEETVLANDGMLLWGNLNYSYNEATMGWVTGDNSDLSWGYYGERGWNDPHLVTYMESHDEQRLMWKNLNHGNSSGDYDVTELSTALDRMKTAGAFFFTIPGPKMLWQYGEIGYDYGLGQDGRGRTDPMPVPGIDYLTDPERLEVYNTWRALTHLATEYEVFRTTDLSLSLGPAVKRIYLNDESMNVAIIGNFDVRERTVSANVQQAGEWWDYLSGDAWNFSAADEQITLGPGEFLLLTTEQLPLPDEVIYTSSSLRPDNDRPSGWQLHQNYPNPFNPATTVSYDIPEPAHVELSVYNIIGQRLATLVNARQSAGTHNVNFDASRLGSGTYILHMRAGDRVFTRKMMLVK